MTITTQPLTAAEQAAADAAADKAPVIGNVFEDIILAAGDPGPHVVLIDARDESGDPVTLRVSNTHPAALQSVLSGNLLSLSPTGAADTAAIITVSATAGGVISSRSLTVLMPGEAVAAGNAVTVGGRFDSQDEIDLYKVVLDGDCTIIGDRGYSNQAFFTSVRNAVQTVVVAFTDGTIGSVFDAGVYYIGASLTDGAVAYDYAPGDHDTYSLAVSCPDADVRTETIAGLLGIDLSGTETLVGDIDDSGLVDLADAILAQRLISGITTSAAVKTAASVGGVNRIGIDDAVHALQHTAGIR